MTDGPVIACTLSPGDYKERIASIQTLTSQSLLRHERRDLTLELVYAPGALARVHDMVTKEQACCSFLSFDVREAEHEVRLIITAPEDARDAADTLFEEFVKGHSTTSSCGCTASDKPARRSGSTVAGVTAVTLATGALACGACCVLPFALPAAALAGIGTILAFLAGAHFWVTAIALLAVLGAWVWITWQAIRTRMRPALSTLLVMGTATTLAALSVFWPSIERQILSMLS
jgi:hypothetical protein